MKNSKDDEVTEPGDTYKIAYILHFFLGAGNLLPWNALITAVDYFGYLYPDRHVERVFSVVYMAASLLVLVLLLNVGGRRRNLSLRVRMNLGFSMFVFSLMATPMMHWGWEKNGAKMMSSSTAYCVVVASVLVCGLADGLIGGSLIGTAGKLPKQYMQAVFAGTASSGVLISILRIITKTSLPQTAQGLKTSAQFYFIVSSAILIGCIISCNILYGLPVMQQHYKNFQYVQTIYSCSTPRFWQTFTKIRFPGFGVFMIYTVTLSIFPGFLAENIKSDLLKEWYPITLISTYNVSDFVGKSLTCIYMMKGIGRATWGCMARLVFYPLFMGCFRGPEWLRMEAPVVVLTVMLGLSNGYLTSVIMILAPKAVPQAEAEVAAIVMSVLLGMGLVAGSVIGWFWII
ncbi:Equilibrative nucleotide transporter 8 [Sesamum alatum]|uniref:Equilibrative nucleotide transporter 8 n=1 Tax=Sesamum alatum TaxID=300844 RepID=A0AAE2CQT6_9LAMI|nr:Equilibrative nucleotide transporter 8 [Sesamum alatum]